MISSENTTEFKGIINEGSSKLSNDVNQLYIPLLKSTKKIENIDLNKFKPDPELIPEQCANFVTKLLKGGFSTLEYTVDMLINFITIFDKY